MSYCDRHHCNNCIECAIERQTKALLEAVNNKQRAPTAPPSPPPERLICDACGDITASGHTNWICRFFGWLDRKSGQGKRACQYSCDKAVIGENDNLVLVYKRQLSMETVTFIREHLNKQGVRATVVVGVDEVYVQRNPDIRAAA
jgi:hypothetical protein